MTDFVSIINHYVKQASKLGTLANKGFSSLWYSARRTFFNLQTIGLLAGVALLTKTRANNQLVKAQNKIDDWIDNHKKNFGLEGFKNILINISDKIQNRYGENLKNYNSLDNNIDKILNPKSYEMDRGDIEIMEMAIGLAGITYANRKFQSVAAQAGIDAAVIAIDPADILITSELNAAADAEIMKGGMTESLITFVATYNLLHYIRHNEEKNGQTFNIVEAMKGIFSKIPIFGKIVAGAFDAIGASDTENNIPSFVNTEEYSNSINIYEDILANDKLGLVIDASKDQIEKYEKNKFEVNSEELNSEEKQKYDEVINSISVPETTKQTKTPGQTETTPGEIPGEIPGFTPGKIKNYWSGEVVGITPGFTPGVVQGFTPGVVSGFTPGVSQGFTPGEIKRTTEPSNPQQKIIHNWYVEQLPVANPNEKKYWAIRDTDTPGIREVYANQTVYPFVPGYIPGFTPGVVEGFTPGVVAGFTPGVIQEKKENWWSNIVNHTIFGDPENLHPI